MGMALLEQGRNKCIGMERVNKKYGGGGSANGGGDCKGENHWVT